METDHRVVVGDARSLESLADDAVELVVTSPPYPMVEMWDGTFAALDERVGDALDAGDGRAAFEAMHSALDDAWAEVARVLAPGGLACVVVGDATRSLGEFRVYPNHARVLDALERHGLAPLPDVLWRKPTNSGTKFMGSGMLPPNAYATLEHEYVLVARNGAPRSFEPNADRRYEAAYFWEERNRWFSDVWTDLPGEPQALAVDAGRDRSGAFPLAVPYRLVCMYSVYGDRVLDPFWGTGTTTLAAMAAGRNSVGVELDPEVAAAFAERVDALPETSRRLARDRLAAHRAFVRERDSAPEYRAVHYDTRVVTGQERRIRLYEATAVRETPEGYAVEHEPFEPSPGRQ
jgi:site-specific DNA-methyltransferase (cytosine-N4-specific)